MTIVLTILFFISMAHFIYDGIILPSIRMHLRNKLFILRDELRQMAIENHVGKKEDKEVFDFLHNGINTFLNRLPLLTIDIDYKFMKKIESDEKLRQVIENRKYLINHCKNESLVKIYNNANEILQHAFIANAGGWFIYLIPIAILIMTASNMLKPFKELLTLPNNAVEQLIPSAA